jgi:hypothetical protein
MNYKKWHDRNLQAMLLFLPIHSARTANGAMQMIAEMLKQKRFVKEELVKF